MIAGQVAGTRQTNDQPAQTPDSPPSHEESRTNARTGVPTDLVLWPRERSGAETPGRFGRSPGTSCADGCWVAAVQYEYHQSAPPGWTCTGTLNVTCTSGSRRLTYGAPLDALYRCLGLGRLMGAASDQVELV
jgi:hypothetical protein